MLRVYVSERQTNWVDYLSLVEFAYNSSWHASIQMSPFEAMYGCKCSTPLNFRDPEKKVGVSKQMLERIDLELSKIRHHIKKAQKKQKLYYDKNKRPLSFNEGDLVFLKVIPKRTNLILGKDRRLSPRFASPLKVYKRVGSLAYKLELPTHVKLHLIFHVALLKKYVSNPLHIL